MIFLREPGVWKSKANFSLSSNSQKYIRVLNSFNNIFLVRNCTELKAIISHVIIAQSFPDFQSYLWVLSLWDPRHRVYNTQKIIDIIDINNSFESARIYALVYLLSYCCAGSFVKGFPWSKTVHLESNGQNNSPCWFRTLRVVFQDSHIPAFLTGEFHDICDLLKGKKSSDSNNWNNYKLEKPGLP